MDRDLALKKAKPILEILDGLKYEIAGSYRRGKQDIGDFDIVCEANGNTPLIKEQIQKVINPYPQPNLSIGGNKRVRFHVEDLQIDILFCHDPNEWGAQLVHLTGSLQFNITHAAKAKYKGLIWGMNGLRDRATKQLIPTPTEHCFFDALGIKYKSPKERG